MKKPITLQASKPKTTAADDKINLLEAEVARLSKLVDGVLLHQDQQFDALRDELFEFLRNRDRHQITKAGIIEYMTAHNMMDK